MKIYNNKNKSEIFRCVFEKKKLKNKKVINLLINPHSNVNIYVIRKNKKKIILLLL